MKEEEETIGSMDKSSFTKNHALDHTRRSTSRDKQDLEHDGSDIPTIGQFSFAPATQTTVVTTTTTTTTKFPPLLMRPPRRMNQLDLKIYPLAGSPTPSSLKNISFTIDGKAAIFREADDTSLALEQLQEEQQTLRNTKGSIQTVEAYEPWVETDIQNIPNPFINNAKASQGRPASPESISDSDDATEERSNSQSRQIPPSLSGRVQDSQNGGMIRSHHRLRGLRSGNPITPISQTRSVQNTRQQSTRNVEQLRQNSLNLLPSPNIEQHPTFLNIQAGLPATKTQQQLSADNDLATSANQSSFGRETSRGVSQETTVPTPPIESDPAYVSRRSLGNRALSSVPSRLHVSESPSANDGSLPSPSLSPVTLAATIQNAGYFADIDSSSEIASPHDLPSLSHDGMFDHTPTRNTYNIPPPMETKSQLSRPVGIPHFASLSVAEIPAMLDYFEAIPDELKSYVMHQLLRRCPKETLHLVADAVNPALKCDFLSVLPPELGLNILKYLDLKSLCKAAQVSRKWRQIINSDEKAWKELFDADGFVLPEGELRRAITEGWGWQDPYGTAGFEKDLRTATDTASESEANLSSASTGQSPNSVSGFLRRSKRKAATMLSGRNKQVKRKQSSAATSLDFVSIDWMSQMSTAEGPYNAANAAILAVPHPQVGISSLKGLHLYKSLYRRHHLIRRNWMFEDTDPRHIAFRAHDTHVVTCLQFDTDRILTGSDDNNINVYDTKTGALRAKLKGHEGGVWALQYVGNTLVSGSTDRSVRVWDIEQGIEKQVFRGHTSTVRCLQIVTPVQVGESADGKPIMMPKQPLIITGSRDSTLRVWKLPRPEDPSFIQVESDNDNDDCPYFVRTLTGHQHSVRAIAAYADTLVSGSYDCSVRVWKISTGETVYRLQGHTQKVYSVVLDHARNRCISGSMDNMVRIWSLDTGSLIHTLEGHTSLVGLLDLNSERLVSAAADSTLRIWDPDNGQCKATLSAHTGAITCFQHDGQKVISGSDRTLKLWNIKTGECIKDLLSDLSGVWQVKFDERRCVAAVQRDGLTYIEVLDYGAARDGVPENGRGRRIVVDVQGFEADVEEP